MNRKLLFVAAASLAAAALADGVAMEGAATGGRRKANAEEREAERIAELRENGGRLDRIPDGPEFVVADMREASSDNAPGRVAETIRTMFKIAATNIVVADDAASPLEAAMRLRKERKALLAVLICGGNAGPALSVYPEERVAVVDAAAAARFSEDTDAEVRIVKECWRAIGFLCGAGYSTNDASVMQPVGSPLELDTVEWQVISPMQFQQMGRFLKKYGAKRGRRTTYRKAVQEGWAQPPTNDYQRAIWDEIHSATNAAATKAAAKAAE